MKQPRNNSSTPKTIPSFEASGLTEEDIEAARERVKRQLADEIVKAELGLSDSILATKKGPLPIRNEEMVTLTIQLEPTGASGDQLVVDGKVFKHGQTVTVTRREANSLREMMARGYQHQAEIDGKDSNFYRRKLNMDVSSGNPQPDLRLPPGLRDI
jgi:hypothetical protein